MVTINGTGFITVGPAVAACDITLGWRPDDPAALTLDTTVRGEPQPQWLLSRDALLRAALGIPAPRVGPQDLGEAARINPERSTIRVDLASPDGKASINIPRLLVEEFLWHTGAHVPIGAEPEHDWDQLLTR